MGIVLCLRRSFSISYDSGVRCQVMASIKLLWNVRLSQWTCFYKLSCNGFSSRVSACLQSKELLCDGAKNTRCLTNIPDSY